MLSGAEVINSTGRFTPAGSSYFDHTAWLTPAAAQEEAFAGSALGNPAFPRSTNNVGLSHPFFNNGSSFIREQLFQRGPIGTPPRILQNGIAARYVQDVLHLDLRLNRLHTHLMRARLTIEDAQLINRVALFAQQNSDLGIKMLRLIELSLRERQHTYFNTHIMMDLVLNHQFDPVSPTDRTDPKYDLHRAFFESLLVLLNSGELNIVLDALIVISSRDIVNEEDFANIFVSLARAPIDDARRRIIEGVLKAGLGGLEDSDQGRFMSSARSYIDFLNSGHNGDRISETVPNLFYVYGNLLAEHGRYRRNDKDNYMLFARGFNSFAEQIGIYVKNATVNGYDQNGSEQMNIEMPLRFVADNFSGLVIQYQETEKDRVRRGREFEASEFSAHVEQAISRLGGSLEVELRREATSRYPDQRGLNIDGSPGRYVPSVDGFIQSMRATSRVFAIISGLRNLAEKAVELADILGHERVEQIVGLVKETITKVRGPSGNGNSGIASGTPPVPSTPPVTPAPSGSGAPSALSVETAMVNSGQYFQRADGTFFRVSKDRDMMTPIEVPSYSLLGERGGTPPASSAPSTPPTAPAPSTPPTAPAPSTPPATPAPSGSGAASVVPASGAAVPHTTVTGLVENNGETSGGTSSDGAAHVHPVTRGTAGGTGRRHGENYSRNTVVRGRALSSPVVAAPPFRVPRGVTR